VEVARRHIRRIDRAVRVRATEQSIDNADSALLLAGVDAIFVATDTALGRYAANALAYQYMIPTFQVGAKVQADADGQIDTIHTAARIALPGYPCRSASAPSRLTSYDWSKRERWSVEPRTISAVARTSPTQASSRSTPSQWVWR